MTKLSIIVPIYKVAQYLCKCVDSLLAQDIPAPEYEIILVDDGSPDECPQICDSYATTHENIHVVHRENGGLSAARNSGIEVAHGEYIMFVDPDDFIEPGVLDGLLKQVNRDNLDVLRYRLQYINPQYEVYNPYKKDPFRGNDYSDVPTDGVSFLNSRMNTQCYAWQFILKRVLLDGCIFTPGIYFEDTDWTPRMLCKAKRVASTNTIVYNYLMREGSISNAVNRSKQKKVLDDKIRLIATLRKQAEDLQKSGRYNRWYRDMISDTVVGIIGMLSVEFYAEKDVYLEHLKQLNIYPLASKSMKARLLNISPRLTIELLHVKNKK